MTGGQKFSLFGWVFFIIIVTSILLHSSIKNNHDYWIVLNKKALKYELWSTNIDGEGVDGIIGEIPLKKCIDSDDGNTYRKANSTCCVVNGETLFCCHNENHKESTHE